VETTELYIYLETIRPIRTAENFEAVEWATGFSNENGCSLLCSLLFSVYLFYVAAMFVRDRRWPQPGSPVRGPWWRQMTKDNTV